ncbi:MAG: DUF3604 domain-containing protein [Halieaceae bacterium]|nr:DUF3604 domain-containing protein [Halieaceae bacterium]
MKALKLGFLVALLTTGLLFAAGSGFFGRSQEVGTPSVIPVDPKVVSQQRARQMAAVPPDASTEILFGDFHVHTTFSADGLIFNLPLLGGQGSHPPADACDFARYCSALDFWSINDHAEDLTPKRWQETVETVRACNAVNADPHNPDTVAFLGWEWTQMGDRPENHYGHRNVILAGLADDEIPLRPVAAKPPPTVTAGHVDLPAAIRILNFLVGFNRDALSVGKYFRETADAYSKACPQGVPVRDMPEGCMDFAATPRELFDRLDDWGVDSIVIPHGTTWGLYTPPGSTWSKQLNSKGHDPQRQFLVESFSGHGNGEVYRPWRAVVTTDSGALECPPPGPDYLPSCWRAGEIIRERCLAIGETATECDSRAKLTRALYIERGNTGYLTVPGASVEDWLDSGQCRDCTLPSFNYRPGGSLQYMLALGNFDHPGPPQRFRFGVIGSSDNHRARPGTGYKEQNRRQMSDGNGFIKGWFNRVSTKPGPAAPDPVDINALGALGRLEADRVNSFLATGGLVAVHSNGRTRDAIWNSVKRKQVYGTSGDRILLWFDAVSGGKTLPMGSEQATRTSPEFQVKAVGAWEQKPGCPDHSRAGLGPERLQALCLNECYNPSDTRKLIERLEIVKISPQANTEEDIGKLIEDPWLVHECPPEQSGCSFSFTDPEYGQQGRDAVYYVRAVQQASPAINGDNLRCEFDEQGNCIAVNPCHGNEALTDYEDDCLAPVNELAWSSPIFVDYPRF